MKRGRSPEQTKDPYDRRFVSLAASTTRSNTSGHARNGPKGAWTGRYFGGTIKVTKRMEGTVRHIKA